MNLRGNKSHLYCHNALPLTPPMFLQTYCDNNYLLGLRSTEDIVDFFRDSSTSIPPYVNGDQGLDLWGVVVRIGGS